MANWKYLVRKDGRKGYVNLDLATSIMTGFDGEGGVMFMVDGTKFEFSMSPKELFEIETPEYTRS